MFSFLILWGFLGLRNLKGIKARLCNTYLNFRIKQFSGKGPTTIIQSNCQFEKLREQCLLLIKCYLNTCNFSTIFWHLYASAQIRSISKHIFLVSLSYVVLIVILLTFLQPHIVPILLLCLTFLKSLQYTRKCYPKLHICLPFNTL